MNGKMSAPLSPFFACLRPPTAKEKEARHVQFAIQLLVLQTFNCTCGA